MDERESKEIQKLIFGDRSIYQKIFNDMYESLCSFVHHFYSNREVCEDCVQEAFISLWESRNKMKSIAHVKSFLYQVSRNNILNYLKHECIKQKYFSQNLSNIQDKNNWMDWVIEEEVERVLRKTTQELSPKCRHILALDLQGKSNSEIALLLGVSENTVKTQKRLVYKRLKDNISELFSLLLLVTGKIF